MDYGYFDLSCADRSADFRRVQCPVTTFLTTGFIDGSMWFWWDQVAHIFGNTRKTELSVAADGRDIRYQLPSAEARVAAAADLSWRWQDAPEPDRDRAIAALGRAADVEVPAAPPSRFAPLSWDEARRLEKRGMTFGPHTVGHPVLAGVSDERAEFEIGESWKRLSAEVRSPVPIFCYPTGRPADSGEREIAILRRLGLSGAVLSQPGAIDPDEFRMSAAARYRVPRFGYPNSLPRVLQAVSGLELLRMRLRRGRAVYRKRMRGEHGFSEGAARDQSTGIHGPG